MTLVVRGRGRGKLADGWGGSSGSIASPPPPPPPPPPGGEAFATITTARSDTSGAQYVQFGIPAAKGLVSAARKAKIFARYGGTIYPVQLDRTITYPSTGDFRWAAGHVKLPAGYVANEKIDIGYSDVETVPAAPNWSTVTSAFTTNFNVEISTYVPKIVMAMQASDAFPGDSISFAITDDIGTQNYSRVLRGDALIGNTRNLGKATLDLARVLTTDLSGRYKCYDQNRGAMLPAEPDDFLSVQKSDFGMGVSITQNVGHSWANGEPWGVGGFNSAQRPNGWVSLASSLGITTIRPRYRAGNPVNYDVAFNITRSGRKLSVKNVSSDLGRINGYEIWNVVQYSTLNGTFNGTFDFINGSTSGATALIRGQTTTSATEGVLYIEGQSGRGKFAVGETITGANGTGAKTAVVVSQRPQLLTDTTSGATAHFEASGGNFIYIRPISGVIADNDDLVMESGATAKADGTTTASLLAMSMNTSDEVGSASGNLPQIQAKADRVTWTAVWNNGANGAIIPAWFNGHQVYELERLAGFVDGSANVHPHLVCRMRVKWDRDGNVLHREFTLENSKIKAGAKDYWYDVAAINVNGTNQIAGTLADWRDMYHQAWCKFTWRGTKPFGLCDPLHHMKSLMIPTWPRHPTRRLDRKSRDLNEYFQSATQGMDRFQDSFVLKNMTAANNTNWLDRGSQFLKAAPGAPLWPGTWKFDGQGGASIEIGPVNGWEWVFWAFDTMYLWPQMEAMCDNPWSAHPYWVRDETATGNDADAPPNMYLKWYMRPADSGHGAVTDKMILGNSKNNEGHDVSGATQAFRLWTGLKYPQDSHSGAHPARSAYLATGDRRFFDNVEQWAWFHGLHRSSNNNAPKSIPKTGGVAGDVNHVIGYDTDNGNRNFAWPTRSYVSTASLMPDDHPRRTYWRRVSQDMANHFTEMTTKTWNGFFHGRGAHIFSDQYGTLNTQLAGERYAGLTSGPYFDTALGVDLFKGLYCSMVMNYAADWEVCDVTTGLSAQAGILKIVNDIPQAGGAWARLLSVFGMLGGPLNAVSPYPPATPYWFATTDCAQILTEVNKNPAELSNTGITSVGGLFVADPRPRFVRQFDGAEIGPDEYNYPKYRFHNLALQGLARNATEPLKTDARTLWSFLESQVPATAAAQYNLDTYEDVWGAWSATMPDMVNTTW